jgi:hypothetical protein
MGRKSIVMLITLVGCTSASSSSAIAAPNTDHANCEAILTVPDAHIRIRDDVAREFAAAEDFRPGDIYSLVAREATGTTPEECVDSIIDDLP